MIAENLAQIRDRIAEAARHSGRTPEEITLVAVSKHQDLSLIQEAISSGQRCFGENYLQEAREKIRQCPENIHWHFIGHLQSNKARQAARLFTTIETVDRLKTAKLLDSAARDAGRQLSVLIQVNVGSDPNKAGILPDSLPALLYSIREQTQLQVKGLMTMPPLGLNPEDSRPHFAALRRLAEGLAGRNLFHDDNRVALSMGMSGDFPIAIEEGATIIRVGTSIFGSR